MRARANRVTAGQDRRPARRALRLDVEIQQLEALARELVDPWRRPDPEARCGISGSDSGCLLMRQVSRHAILVCERFSRPRYDMEDIMNSIHDVALYATGSRSNLTRTRRRDHYSPSLSSSIRGWSRQSAPASMRRAPLISNMASWHRHQWPAGSGRCPQHAASRAGRVSRRRLV